MADNTGDGSVPSVELDLDPREGVGCKIISLEPVGGDGVTLVNYGSSFGFGRHVRVFLVLRFR